MRFKALGETWKVELDGIPQRAVVIEIADIDDGRRAKLSFDDDAERWFGWMELTQAGKWQLATCPRPAKSADELQAMVIEKAQGHPEPPLSIVVEPELRAATVINISDLNNDGALRDTIQLEP